MYQCEYFPFLLVPSRDPPERDQHLTLLSPSMPTAHPRTPAAALKLVQRFRMRELGRADVRPVLLAADAVPPTAARPISPSPRVPNPFLNQRHPVTGRWQEPKYSRRRQAELVKAAKLSGTLHLLPPGPKLRPSEIADFKVAHEKKRFEEAKAAGLLPRTHLLLCAA